MRVHVGDVGPIPGVQAFECNSTLTVDRRNEYDSDEVMVIPGLAEYAGNLEVLDINKDLIFKGLLGKKPTDPNVADVAVDNLGTMPIMLNVWDQFKTKFIKSYLVTGPVWTDMPFPTTVDGITTLRFAFTAVKGVKFPNHACGFTVASVTGSPPAPGAIAVSNYHAGRTVVQLSRRYQNSYILAVVNRITDTGSSTNEYTYNYLCWDATLTTATTLYLTDTPVANSQLIVYYAYSSLNEAGGYVCSTL